ncbi:MAG: hypothetical protein ACLSAZ_10375 [Blautia wexlerae]
MKTKKFIQIYGKVMLAGNQRNERKVFQQWNMERNSESQAYCGGDGYIY